MDRRACVDLPALALQLLVAANPEWKKLPVAVVDADEPNGILLRVNAAAWRAKLRPGMRYASALALHRQLRAGTVASSAVEAAVRDITATLRLYTPHVEPSSEEPGVFWLDAGGLERIYTSIEAWARAVARAIRAKGFDAHLVAGFTRFGTYALAKAMAGTVAARPPDRRMPAPPDRHRPAPPDRRRPAPPIDRRRPLPPAGVLVCESNEEERRLVHEVPLERLGIDAKLGAALSRLGIHTVADFTRLPEGGIRRRFGEEALHLHRRARGEAWDPLVPLAPEEPLRLSVLLEDPVYDTGILLFIARGLLARLLEPLAARELAAKTVIVTLHRSLRRDSPPLVLEVSAAEPTLEEAVLADLVRLRLEAGLRRELAGASVVEIEVEIRAAPAAREQLRMFRDRTRRDLAAGARAMARLRAELGENAVVRAVLRQGHLPEATYAWEPIEKLQAPSPRVVLRRPLVRRIYEHAVALPPRPFRERDDSWITPVAADDSPSGNRTPGGHGKPGGKRRVERSTAHGRVDNMSGPYIVSGGWWNREVHREYHYAITDDGEILWVYYDRPRRRWFLSGKVE